MSTASSSGSTRITLAPTPGFTVKSVSTTAAVYTLSTTPSTPDTARNVLEPVHQPNTLAIPKGVKIFINMAWDKNVPAPPSASEGSIRRAMMGEDLEDGEGAYVVPVVVSEPRPDTDKCVS